MDKYFENTGHHEHFDDVLARPANQIILPILVISIFSTMFLWSNLTANTGSDDGSYHRSKVMETEVIVPTSEKIEGIVGPDSEKEILVKPAMAGLPV